MIVNGISGMFANQSFSLDRGALTFGRSTSSCNILFPDNTKGISRNHCKIEQNGAMCTITDLGSSYGTFVNGMKIQQYVPTTLKNGDVFYLGDKSNVFSCQDPNTAVAAGSIPSSAPVTYLNGNPSQRNPASAGMIIGIAIAVVIAISIGLVAFVAINNSKTQQQMTEAEKRQIEEEKRQVQQQLDAEQNKGLSEDIMDVIDHFFD